MLPHDAYEYDLSGAIVCLLQILDPEAVGSWSEIIEDGGSAPTKTQ